MTDSILDSIKKLLGYQPDYTAFDTDITLHINSVFSTLHQIGVGPEEGFEIENSSSKWEEFLGGNLKINTVKSYVYFRVRLMFDPPTTSYAQESMQKQINEMEWRLQVATDPKKGV